MPADEKVVVFSHFAPALVKAWKKCSEKAREHRELNQATRVTGPLPPGCSPGSDEGGGYETPLGVGQVGGTFLGSRPLTNTRNASAPTHTFKYNF